MNEIEKEQNAPQTDSCRLQNRSKMEKKMNRQEHLDWCKERALKHCENGEALMAWLSFRSDMRKHELTREHIALPIGDQICGNFLQSPETMIAIELMNLTGVLNIRRFIEGFN